MNRAEEPVADSIYLSAADGKEDELRDTMLEIVGTALALPGARSFSILQSTKKPADFLVIERWSSDEMMRGGAEAAVLPNALSRVADRTVVASSPKMTRWTRII